MIELVQALLLALLSAPSDRLPDQAADDAIGDVAPTLEVTWIASPPPERAQATVLVFWATWCSGCKRRLPTLAIERERYAARGVAFVGIAIDEGLASVREFAAEQGGALPFHAAHDSIGSVWRAFGGPGRMVGIPYGFVLDRDRRVTWHGPLDDELFRRLDDTLAGEADLESARIAVAGRAGSEALERRIRNERHRYLELAAATGSSEEAAQFGRLHVERYGTHIGAMCYLAYEICRNPSLADRDHALAIAAAEAGHRASGEGTPSVMNVLGLALFEGGRRQEALAVLERALRIAEEDRDAHGFDLQRIQERLWEFRSMLGEAEPPSGVEVAPPERGASGGSTASLAGAGRGLVLSFEPHSAQVVLPVWIGAQGPFRFTLDTGSSMGVCLDQRARARLGLERVGTIGNADGSGSVVPRELVAIEGLRLGVDGMPLEASRALVADYGFVSLPGEDPVDGILGFPLFEAHLLTIDYAKEEVRVAAGFLDQAEPHVVRYTGSDGRPHVSLAVGERVVSALVDTGSSTGLILPGSWRHELPLEGEPVIAGRLQGPNGLAGYLWSARPGFEVRVAGHTLELDRVSFVDGREEAVLGRRAFGAYALSFDQRRRLARFALP